MSSLSSSAETLSWYSWLRIGLSVAGTITFGFGVWAVWSGWSPNTYLKAFLGSSVFWLCSIFLENKWMLHVNNHIIETCLALKKNCTLSAEQENNSSSEKKQQ